MCEADAAARGVRLSRNLCATRYVASADAPKLTQVWTNLLKNAVKFSQLGGAVFVRTSDAAPTAGCGSRCRTPARAWTRTCSPGCSISTNKATAQLLGSTPASAWDLRSAKGSWMPMARNRTVQRGQGQGNDDDGGTDRRGRLDLRSTSTKPIDFQQLEAMIPARRLAGTAATTLEFATNEQDQREWEYGIRNLEPRHCPCGAPRAQGHRKGRRASRRAMKPAAPRKPIYSSCPHCTGMHCAKGWLTSGAYDDHPDRADR